MAVSGVAADARQGWPSPRGTAKHRQWITTGPEFDGSAGALPRDDEQAEALLDWGIWRAVCLFTARGPLTSWLRELNHIVHDTSTLRFPGIHHEKSTENPRMLEPRPCGRYSQRLAPAMA